MIVHICAHEKLLRPVMVVWGAVLVWKIRKYVVARDGVEPSTFRVSVGRSYQLSYLA